MNVASSTRWAQSCALAALVVAGTNAPARAQNAPQTLAVSNATSNVVAGETRRENVGGARWVWNVDRTSARVAFSVLVRAGANDETYETAGWRRVLAQAMLRATNHTKGSAKTREVRDAELEAMGARLGATVNDDAIEFWATGDSAHASRVLEVLLNVVRNPRLSDEDINAARATVRSQRAATFNDVASLATEALDTRLYRDFANRPIAYGLPEVGSAKALEAIDAAKLRDLHGRFFRPANFSIGTSGDLDVTGVRSFLTNRLKLLFGLSNASNNAVQTNAPLFSTVVAGEPITLSRDLGGSGDWVFVSYRVSDAAQNDLPALQVLTAALGASPLGRVPLRLLNAPNANTSSTRSAPNAAQQASVVLVPRRWGGELVLFAQSQSRALGAGNATKIESLRDALTEEVQKMRSRALTESEMTNARRYAIGSWALDRESLRSRAFRLALDEEWRSAANTRPVWMSSERASLNNEYSISQETWTTRVQNVTASEVQNVARRYLNVGATVFVRSGESGIEPFFGQQ